MHQIATPNLSEITDAPARKSMGNTSRRSTKFTHVSRHWKRRTAQAALALTVVGGGLVAFGTAAWAHANIVTGVASCASPLGSGYKITWTVANDYNLSETAQVGSATGGLSTVTPLSFTIVASGNGSGGNGTQPYKTKTLAQALPASASGTITLSVNATFSDGFQVTNSGSMTLPGSCGKPPTTTTTTPPTTTTTPHSTTTTTTPRTVTTTTTPHGTTTTTVPGTVTTTTPSPGTPTTTTPSPGLTIVKTERIAGSPSFVRGPIDAIVGDRIDYRLLVTNTGNTSLNVVVTDAKCDAGTIAPTGTQVIAAGASVDYTCSHVLGARTSVDFRNIAYATGTTPTGTTVGPFHSTVYVVVHTPVLRVNTLIPAKPAIPVKKNATFTG
jgi:hypothetical protein